MEVAGEGGGVAFLGVGKVANGAFGEVEAEHGADPVEGRKRHAEHHYEEMV